MSRRNSTLESRSDLWLTHAGFPGYIHPQRFPENMRWALHVNPILELPRRADAQFFLSYGIATYRRPFTPQALLYTYTLHYHFSYHGSNTGSIFDDGLDCEEQYVRCYVWDIVMVSSALLHPVRYDRISGSYNGRNSSRKLDRTARVADRCKGMMYKINTHVQNSE
jgi:hypothetical protein